MSSGSFESLNLLRFTSLHLTSVSDKDAQIPPSQMQEDSETIITILLPSAEDSSDLFLILKKHASQQPPSSITMNMNNYAEAQAL